LNEEKIVEKERYLEHGRIQGQAAVLPGHVSFDRLHAKWRKAAFSKLTGFDLANHKLQISSVAGGDDTTRPRRHGKGLFFSLQRPVLE
jgi:hypothetical protein